MRIYLFIAAGPLIVFCLYGMLIFVESDKSNYVLEASEPEIFTPTKFGPLRRKQPSRYSLLALWEATENSLESCMDAVNTIFPHLQDNRCSDIDRAFQLVSRCGRYQRNGFDNLGSTQLGLWDAFPKIISLTKSLDSDSKAMVVSKLSSSTALYDFNRVAVLHASCHRYQSISTSSSVSSPLQLVDSSVGYVRSELKLFGP